MPRLTETQRAKILAEYHVGKSQRELAIKYDVSPTVINRLCKDLDRKNVNTVDTLTRIRVELAGKSEFEVQEIHKEVDRRAQDMELFRKASIIVLEKALCKVTSEDLSMADIERAQSVIGKGKDNIYGKQPDTAVQINNDNSKTTYGWED